MNRKTNIFYNNSQDSKFITFSNYTEALTGDILSVDYKLWPSRFLCVNIELFNDKNLTEDDIKSLKEDLILKLESYYENKLAVIRDAVDNANVIKPLNYLIIFLYWWAYEHRKDTDFIIPTRDVNNSVTPIDVEIELKKNNANLLSLVQFNYISDIVEQQYNGTYSDIICTINPNVWNKPVINFTNIEDEEIESYYIQNDSVMTINNDNHLYGWAEVDDPQNIPNGILESENDNVYKHITQNAIHDDTLSNTESENGIPVYYVKSLIDNIGIVKETSSQSLTFNMIIPLFNIINTKNSYDINENENHVVLNNNLNIPLGIYFTDDVKGINLNINDKFATNWSLLISTQFSPFPYSFDITQNFDNSSSIKQAYITFAEILSKQTEFTNIISKYDKTIKSLQERIILLESQLNNISSVQNIDELSQNINNIAIKQEQLENDFNNKIEEIRNLIETSRIKWQTNN